MAIITGRILLHGLLNLKDNDEKMIKYILMRIYHHSTMLSSWSWQKLYGDRENGYGYKKRKR